MKSPLVFETLDRKVTMDFKNKVVVITGGSSGIGLCIVTKLLTTDVKVITLFELDNPNSNKVLNDLKKQHGQRIDFYPCDVTNTSQLEGCFDKVIQKYKVLDILINNAGILGEKVAERMIDINYKAVVLGSLMMIDRVGKHKGGKGGLIINVASILGLTNFVLPIYCSTKHAVVSFTRTMDMEQFNKTGVRVIAICPGVTTTTLLNDLPNGLDFIDTEGKLDMLGSSQSPENVASALLKIVGESKSGDVWVTEEDQPPYLVKDVENYQSLRMN